MKIDLENFSEQAIISSDIFRQGIEFAKGCPFVWRAGQGEGTEASPSPFFSLYKPENTFFGLPSKRTSHLPPSGERARPQ